MTCFPDDFNYWVTNKHMLTLLFRLNGSYEALKGGSSSEAMEDFTGGICEVFNMAKDLPKDFDKIMLKAHERYSLMACQIDVSTSQEFHPSELYKFHERERERERGRERERERERGRKGGKPLVNQRNLRGVERERQRQRETERGRETDRERERERERERKGGGNH